MNERPDDPQAVMGHAARYSGGTALVILGGASAIDWEKIKEAIKPDVIIGANGVSTAVDCLDYHMIAENMTRTAQLADKGDERAIGFMKMFNRRSGIRLISHRSWHLLNDYTNTIRIRRQGYDALPKNFPIREYGDGYLSGWIMKKNGVGVQVRVGTVGLQIIHHACILGCSKIHTIGYDLQFKGDAHHFYKWPGYQSDRFRNDKMFTEFKGVPTQWFWIETAQYLLGELKPVLDANNIFWEDHSDGLLSRM